MLKPTDKLIVRIRANDQAAAKANTEVAPKVKSPEGRTHDRRVKATGSIEN